MNDIKTWNHVRKGRITGRIVKEVGDPGDEFVFIELAKDTTLGMASIDNRLDADREAGEVIQVRKSFLTEVK